MAREKITFAPNTPVQTQLDKSESKPIEGRNGQTDYMRVCDADERIMFCPQSLENAIQESGAQAGDVIRIIQRGTGKATRWDVGIISESQAHTHQADHNGAPRKYARPVAEPLGISTADIPAGRSISSEAAEMTTALQAAIEAAHAAEIYAARAGMQGFRLNPADVKALACTIYIQRFQESR